mgnify:CR=1 FL=1
MHLATEKYAELGYLGVNLAEEYGGSGGTHLDAVIVLEELAKISIAVAFPVFESCFGPSLAVAHFGNERLKIWLLPEICSGNIVLAVSMSEPEAGSALTDLATKGFVEGDSFVLNGTKRWCSGAGHAEAYVVYCRMSDEKGAKGIGAVVVEKGTPGFTFGKQESHMGFRGVSSADMHFDNVKIPTSNILVPAGGFNKLMEAFDLQQENVASRESYGEGNFAAGCLMARRLIESGVTFVEVTSGNWDTHFDNYERTTDLCRQVDRPYARLLEDLKDRGLLDTTLVIWMGEFGRTPRINARGGRDHFPRAYSVALAGCGVRGGQVIGRTSESGEEILEGKNSVPNLLTTIYDKLGIDAFHENMSSVGRPIRVVENGALIDDI